MWCHRVMISHSPQQSLPAKEWHNEQMYTQTPHFIHCRCRGRVNGEVSQQLALLESIPQGLSSKVCRRAPWDSPLPTEGHRGVSVERVLCAWGQPYPVPSPARCAASTYLMRFYGFRRCKLYSLSQTSKTFLHLPSLTCQVSLGML